MDSLRYELLTREEFADAVGRPVGTVVRWALTGLLGLKLPRRYVGGVVHHTMADYRKWQAEVDRRRLGPEPPEPARARARRLKAVDERLRRRGMKV